MTGGSLCHSRRLLGVGPRRAINAGTRKQLSLLRLTLSNSNRIVGIHTWKRLTALWRSTRASNTMCWHSANGTFKIKLKLSSRSNLYISHLLMITTPNPIQCSIAGDLPKLSTSKKRLAQASNSHPGKSSSQEEIPWTQEAKEQPKAPPL